jgi:hypothetical protein
MFIQEAPANAAVDPPFTTHALDTHAVPPPSQPRSRTAPFHLNGSEQPLQSTASVAWEATPDIPPSGLIQYTSNPLTPSILTSDQTHQTHQTHSSGTSWPMMASGESPAGLSGPHRVQDEDLQWSAGHAQSDYASYAPQTQLQYSAGPSALAQSARRPSTRKKIAKVPSSFVERQEKLKVSRRKGPLLDKQREKTHTMRKTKRICVRCRFYKSGVSVLCPLQAQS